MDDTIDIGIQEILVELDPLGRALFDAAHQKAINRKLVAKLRGLAPADPVTES